MTYEPSQVPVHMLLSKFIDTYVGLLLISISIYIYTHTPYDRRHFQRLRDVKQLGTSHFVWPGATHTRFEHSLGISFRQEGRREGNN